MILRYQDVEDLDVTKTPAAGAEEMWPIVMKSSAVEIGSKWRRCKLSFKFAGVKILHLASKMAIS